MNSFLFVSKQSPRSDLWHSVRFSPQTCSSSSPHAQWGGGRATPEALFLQGRAPSPVLMGSSASGPGKVLLDMRSQDVHQELSTAALALPLQNCHAKKGM